MAFYRRTILSTLSAGWALVPALVACRPSPAPREAAPQPAKGPVTLRLHIQAGGYGTWSQKWGDRIKQEQPNVTVAVEAFPTAGQEYFTKIKTMLATDTLGDLVWTWATQGLLPELSHLKVWRPIDDLVRVDRFDLKQYYPAITEGLRFRGALMGLPFHGHPGFPSFFYNADLFAKRGLAVPDDRWTLETLVDTARKLTVREGSVEQFQFGWWSQAGYHPLIAWARIFGGDLISADGKKSELHTTGTRAAVEWLVNARFRHRVEPTPDERPQSGAPPVWFADGRFAMQQADSAQVSMMHQRVEVRFKWSVALLPPGPTGRRPALTTPHNMGITTQSKAVAEAWAFLKSYTSKEAGVDKVLDGAGVPGGRPDSWNDPRILSGVPEYKVVARAFEYAKPEHAPANFRGLEASAAIDRELQPVFNGTEGVEAGLARASSVLQAILDQPA
ncbi:MAG: extracellular solute-binding protein [Chloroflexi bacterium]|nr:extracellular solute-binding protein [Chloroflexota bacterium]